MRRTVSLDDKRLEKRRIVFDLCKELAPSRVRQVARRGWEYLLIDPVADDPGCVGWIDDYPTFEAVDLLWRGNDVYFVRLSCVGGAESIIARRANSALPLGYVAAASEDKRRCDELSPFTNTPMTHIVVQVETKCIVRSVVEETLARIDRWLA